MKDDERSLYDPPSKRMRREPRPRECGHTANMGHELHRAAFDGLDRRVKALCCDHGANVNAQIRSGLTALHCAAVRGHNSTVDLLSELGADASLVGAQGRTALQLAALEGHNSTLRSLVYKLGSDVGAVSEIGNAAVHYAALNGRDSTLSLLVSELGAQVDASDEVGATAFHIAAKQGRISTIRVLSKLGADVDACTEVGLTALHIAAVCNHESTIQVLVRELGAVLDTENTEGCTAVHLAAERGNKCSILALAEVGADLNAKAWGGETALRIAEENDHVEIVRILGDIASTQAKAREGRTADLYLAIWNGNAHFLAQWLHLLPDVSRKELFRMVSSAVRDANACKTLLFGQMPPGSLWGKIIAHDGNRGVLMLIESFLLNPKEAPRRYLLEVHKEMSRESPTPPRCVL